ncbi:DUF922 domain-containing protein [Psychroserpens burtonensis]|uniref:DUF922 domain-containing protein n=1 Tax=Psychroserpens burtonensis TaxID=49278 RepID=A0A5C7B683_9FLAO|nr:DUF922 domain-containing protein [Psychroserpens burtonensis]TXE15990.1 DUF922 domain-containing protein [Psychroserpens burtonensis]
MLILKPAIIEEVTISWSDSKKLTWSDFKGQVEQNTDAVAVTASGIAFSFSVSQSNDKYIDFNAISEAYFYPEKSWYLKNKGDDYILAHEQLHFDITELHVRQLRFNISRVNVSQNIKQELRDLHEQANKNLAIMQNDYDTQTDNSINKTEQAIWSQFVKIELYKYKDFRSK